MTEPAGTVTGQSGPGEAQRPRSRRRRRRYHSGEVVAAYLCLAPSAVIFAGFMYYPLYRLFVEATHQSNSFGTKSRYVGWGNITEVLTGEDFLDSSAHAKRRQPIRQTTQV